MRMMSLNKTESQKTIKLIIEIAQDELVCFTKYLNNYSDGEFELVIKSGEK